MPRDSTYTDVATTKLCWNFAHLGSGCWHLLLIRHTKHIEWVDIHFISQSQQQTGLPGGAASGGGGGYDVDGGPN